MMKCFMDRMIVMLVFLGSFFLTGTQAYAAAIPLHAERLNESGDCAAVKHAGEDLCALVNSLTGNDSIHTNDIDWNRVYKIYVDESDIFSLAFDSKETILQSMDYIWSYMDEIDGRNVRVTISRASMPEHALAEQGVITEEKYAELTEKAGIWTVPEAEIDTNQTPENIAAYLENAGISAEDDVILIGGTPKLRSLFAVTFAGEQADQVIPLAQTGVIIPHGLGTRGMEHITESRELTAGEAYDFKQLSQVLNTLSIEDRGNEGDGGKLIIFTLALAAILLVLLLTVKIKKRRAAS